MTQSRGLFLDRDGVINVERGYVYRRTEFEFVDGIFELCQRAVEFGYLIFVITNQAGIGRGYYSELDFFALTDWMCSNFHARGVSITKVYFCPDHPTDGLGKYKVDSPFRKPAPGMILQAAHEFDVDLSRSILIGDKKSDIQAGKAAGIGCNVLFCALDHQYQSSEQHSDSPRIATLADGMAFFRRL